MITILKSAVIKASDILDEILRVIDNPDFNKQQERARSQAKAEIKNKRN